MRARSAAGLFSRTEAVIALERQFACSARGPMSVVVHRARGAAVEDVRGKAYLDCTGGEGAGLFGQLRPDLLRAFSAGLARGGSCLGAQPLYRANCARLARLCAAEKALILPSEGHAVDLLGELVDAWARSARGAPRGESWLCFSRQGASGCSLRSCAASDDVAVRVGFDPFPRNCETIDANSLFALEKNLAANDRIAAFALNPLPLRAGMFPAEREYLAGLRALCEEYGVLLVLDERFCGCGRTGTFAYHRQLGLAPDLVLLGGGLAGGFGPMGAVAGRADLLGDLLPETTDPALAGVVDAALGLMEEGELLAEARRKGEYLLSRLREGLRGARIVCDVRGVGLMLCVQIWSFVAVNDVDLTVKLARRGLLVSSVANNVFIFPPLDVTFEECHCIAETVKEVFDEYY